IGAATDAAGVTASAALLGALARVGQSCPSAGLEPRAPNADVGASENDREPAFAIGCVAVAGAAPAIGCVPVAGAAPAIACGAATVAGPAPAIACGAATVAG